MDNKFAFLEELGLSDQQKLRMLFAKIKYKQEIWNKSTDPEIDYLEACWRFLVCAGFPATPVNLGKLEKAVNSGSGYEGFLVEAEAFPDPRVIASEFLFCRTLHQRDFAGPQERDATVVAWLGGQPHFILYALANSWWRGELSFEVLKMSFARFSAVRHILSACCLEPSTLIWPTQIRGLETLRQLANTASEVTKCLRPVSDSVTSWQELVNEASVQPNTNARSGSRTIWGYISEPVLRAECQVKVREPGIEWMIRVPETRVKNLKDSVREPTLAEVIERLKYYVNLEMQTPEVPVNIDDEISESSVEECALWDTLFTLADIPAHMRNLKIAKSLIIENASAEQLKERADHFLNDSDLENEEVLRQRYTADRFNHHYSAAVGFLQAMKTVPNAHTVALTELWLKGRLELSVLRSAISNCDDARVNFAFLACSEAYSEISFEGQWLGDNELSWVGHQVNLLEQYLKPITESGRNLSGAENAYEVTGVIWWCAQELGFRSCDRWL